VQTYSWSKIPSPLGEPVKVRILYLAFFLLVMGSCDGMGCGRVPEGLPGKLSRLMIVEEVEAVVGLVGWLGC
jgi:hypothetical protein